ncbi:uncharacterized protein LOC112392753 [Neophocaena asiaeorientalis asiaeorientalis]|uniref:Uncharacterized protein LOC112392753 n=1 Tax=Neophocaena asiaeorientalis asiaeorientalis TaxID=1706337 RepID=A0A341AIA6_NEOAA|nr:uncharacterized protein LOC112392753 [Neophocaena asiaeorientalis asiaeorientalis]
MPNPILPSPLLPETPATRLQPSERPYARRAKQQQTGREGEFCGSISEEGEEEEGPGTEAHCSLPRLLPRSASAPPGAGRLARGPRGERRRGQRPPGPARVQAGRERVAGRRVRAGSSAVAQRVLLLGRRRRRRLLLQPSSQRRAAPGLGQHFPAVSHTPLREKSLLHTRTRPQTARSLEKIRNSGSRAKGVAEAKSSTEVRRLGSPLRAADAGGAGRRWRREANSVRQAKPLSPPFAPAGWHPSSRPCGLGRETAAAPPHISGLRAEAERWPLPQDWLKARTGVRGSGEV